MADKTNPSTKGKVSALAWVIAILAIIAATFISVNNNKMPATATLVIPALGITGGDFSFLMSLNGYVGFVLAFVAASIILKFGSKTSTLMVLICALVGAIISAVSTNYGGLMVGRLIEGVGYACIGTVVPVLISEWFPKEKRGVPMGIFSVWVPLGSLFIMGTAANFFTQSDPTTYHNVFWFVVVLLAIVTVLWAIIVKKPEHSYLEAETDPNAEKPKVSEGFKSVSCWVSMIAFAAFSLGTACVMNFETYYMVNTQIAADQAAANGMMNILNISVIIGGVAIGFVMNAVKSNSGRLVILAICAAILGVCFAMAYSVTAATLTPWLVIFGLSNGIVPAVFFTMVAEIAPRPDLAGVASTLMSLGQCVGGIIFGSVGAIVATADPNVYNWGAATGLLTATGIVLFVGSLALLFVLKKRDAKPAVAK